MMELMLHLKVHLRVQFKGPLIMHKKVTKRTHSTLQLMVHLKVHFVSAIEESAEGSFEDRTKVVPWDLYTDVQEGAFEVEIKGALEVKVELHLKMRMVVHLSGHRSAQNDSIKRWTWGGSLCCTWAHLRFHFREHLKMHNIVKKMMHFTPRW